jgi:gliding motility-associated lipoprotein GldH
MMNKTIITIALLVLTIILITACDRTRVFEENKKIPDGAWKQDFSVGLDAEITDTTTMQNILVNVRNAGDYNYSNLFLFVKMVFPDGKVTSDTLECTLADPSGKWQGDGLGDIWNHQIMFKPHILFPRTGKYHFEIQQGMRTETVKGIMDVGIRIEKSQGLR